MNVSVIICSYNPTLHLSYALDSLLSQSKDIYQIVVVIDNDNYSDYAKTMLDKYQNSFNLLTIHVQVNSGRAAARNTGVKLSEGDLFLFLDDDMIAEDDLVEKHLAYHVSNPGSIIIGNGFRNPVYARDDFSKYLIELERSWTSDAEVSLKVDFKNFIFTACNMSVSNNLFARLNGFDEKLKDGEDFDFGVRAIKEGINIIYDRALLAWHNDWPDIKSFISRQNEYYRGKTELFRIHPEYLEYFPHMLQQKIPMIKRIIYKLINAPGMWIVTYGSTIFSYLPASTKFKTYNLVVASGTTQL